MSSRDGSGRLTRRRARAASSTTGLRQPTICRDLDTSDDFSTFQFTRRRANCSDRVRKDSPDVCCSTLPQALNRGSPRLRTNAVNTDLPVTHESLSASVTPSVSESNLPSSDTTQTGQLIGCDVTETTDSQANQRLSVGARSTASLSLVCPVCLRRFSNTAACQLHTKRCARAHGLGPRQLVGAVALQQRQSDERARQGLPEPVSARAPQVGRRKNSSARARTLVELSSGESDLQLALAVSASLHDQQQQQQQETAEYQLLADEQRSSSQQSASSSQHSMRQLILSSGVAGRVEVSRTSSVPSVSKITKSEWDAQVASKLADLISWEEDVRVTHDFQPSNLGCSALFSVWQKSSLVGLDEDSCYVTQLERWVSRDHPPIDSLLRDFSTTAKQYEGISAECDTFGVTDSCSEQNSAEPNKNQQSSAEYSSTASISGCCQEQSSAEISSTQQALMSLTESCADGVGEHQLSDKFPAEVFETDIQFANMSHSGGFQSEKEFSKAISANSFSGEKKQPIYVQKDLEQTRQMESNDWLTYNERNPMVDKRVNIEDDGRCLTIDEASGGVEYVEANWNQANDEYCNKNSALNLSGEISEPVEVYHGAGADIVSHHHQHNHQHHQQQQQHHQQQHHQQQQQQHHQHQQQQQHHQQQHDQQQQGRTFGSLVPLGELLWSSMAQTNSQIPTDCRIRCRNGTVSAHRLVLQARDCSLLNTSVESFSVRSVLSLLEFLYTGRFNKSCVDREVELLCDLLGVGERQTTECTTAPESALIPGSRDSVSSGMKSALAVSKSVLSGSDLVSGDDEPFTIDKDPSSSDGQLRSSDKELIIVDKESKSVDAETSELQTTNAELLTNRPNSELSGRLSRVEIANEKSAASSIAHSKLEHRVGEYNTEVRREYSNVRETKMIDSKNIGEDDPKINSDLSPITDMFDPPSDVDTGDFEIVSDLGTRSRLEGDGGGLCCSVASGDEEGVLRDCREEVGEDEGVLQGGWSQVDDDCIEVIYPQTSSGMLAHTPAGLSAASALDFTDNPSPIISSRTQKVDDRPAARGAGSNSATSSFSQPVKGYCTGSGVNQTVSMKKQRGIYIDSGDELARGSGSGDVARRTDEIARCSTSTGWSSSTNDLNTTTSDAVTAEEDDDCLVLEAVISQSRLASDWAQSNKTTRTTTTTTAVSPDLADANIHDELPSPEPCSDQNIVLLGSQTVAASGFRCVGRYQSVQSQIGQSIARRTLSVKESGTGVVMSPSRTMQGEKARDVIGDGSSEVKNLPSPLKHVQSPSRKAQSPLKNVESPIKKVQSPVRKVRSPIRKVQSPSRKVQSPSRKVQSPSKQVHSPQKQLRLRLNDANVSQTSSSSESNRKVPAKPLPEQSCSFLQPGTSRTGGNFGGSAGGLSSSTSFVGSTHSASTPTAQRHRVTMVDSNTPMPNYVLMLTPELKAELARIGVKPIARRKAVALLKHVFDETHPTLEATQLSRPPAAAAKRLADSSSSLPAAKHPRSSANTVARSTVSLRNQSPAKSALGTKSSPLSSPMKSQRGVEGVECLSSASSDDGSTRSDEEMCPEESILFEKGLDTAELLPCSQMLPEAEVNATISAFIRSRPQLYKQILVYEPVWLEPLHAQLRADGVRVSLSRLIDFLDDQCITFRTQNSGRRRRSPKKPKRTAKKTTSTNRGSKPANA